MGFWKQEPDCESSATLDVPRAPFRNCWPLTHTWDYGHEPLVITNTILYTCLVCGKTKRGYWA